MEINSRYDHFNISVLDLERSLTFYDQALGLKEVRRRVAPDGFFILVFLKDSRSDFLLELTWLRDRTEPYDLGEGESHLCIRVADDYKKVREYHEDMGYVCYDNTLMGIYFIEDPDGHWIEILPHDY
jgi:lactoylglutathione lyase